MTCSVFVNLGSFITQMVIFLAIKLLVYLLKRIVKNRRENQAQKKNPKNKLFENSEKKGQTEIGRERSTGAGQEDQNQDKGQQRTKKRRFTFGVLGPGPSNKLRNDRRRASEAPSYRSHRLNIFNRRNQANNQKTKKSFKIQKKKRKIPTKFLT